MTCGQNIALKSVSRRLQSAQAQTDAKHAKPKRREQPGLDTLFERDGDRGRQELRHARDQHDRADLKSVMASDEGQKDGHEINGAEQADP